MEKRGQGLSTSSIILIILGVVVLVVLVLGFSMGWEKVAPWISSGENNVQTISNACQVACSTGSIYDYCSKQRELKDSSLPGDKKSVNGTCYDFATNSEYSAYAISDCSTIDCELMVLK